MAVEEVGLRETRGKGLDKPQHSELEVAGLTEMQIPGSALPGLQVQAPRRQGPKNLHSQQLEPYTRNGWNFSGALSSSLPGLWVSQSSAFESSL